jgi:hypothetical protein
MSKLIKILKDWKECIDILDKSNYFLVTGYCLLSAVKEDEQYLRKHIAEQLKSLDVNHIVYGKNNKELIKEFEIRTGFKYE